MANTTDPTANGSTSVTISEAEYRLLVAERDELRNEVEGLRLQYAALRDAYRSVHHAYYLKVKDELGLDTEEVPPPDMEGAIPVSQFLAEIEREFGGK